MKCPECTNELENTMPSNYRCNICKLNWLIYNEKEVDTLMNIVFKNLDIRQLEKTSIEYIDKIQKDGTT